LDEKGNISYRIVHLFISLYILLNNNNKYYYLKISIIFFLSIGPSSLHFNVIINVVG